MNNSKVRIYELSRELNLENKDILGICDQLSISVKSHSSTITESEAERIRSQAGKYSAHQAPAKRLPERAERKSGSPSPVPNRHNAQHKQQILEIKHQSSPGYNPQPSGSRVATGPQPPSTQQATSSMKQTALNRPVRAPQQEVNPTPGEQSLESEPEILQMDSVDSPEEELFKEEQPSRPAAIAAPPVRPVSSTETHLNQELVQPAMVERPVLKRQKVDQPVVAKSPQTEVKPAVKKPAPTSEPPTVQPRPAVEMRERPPAQPVPELQRPQRKDRNSLAETPVLRDAQKPSVVRKVVGAPTRDDVSPSGGDGSEKMGEPDVLDLELRRPTPPRIVKDRKHKEEEEDDLENANKASKVGRRQPRQLRLDEDEDDFETDLEDLPETVTVSLSMARPPKPKSRPAQPVAMATLAPGVSKARKPGARSSDNAQARETKRGREQKEAERPEKVVLDGSMTLRELATALAVPETEIIKKLFFKGMAVNITQTLDLGTATMVAEELGVEVETAQEKSNAIKETEWLDEADMESLQRRPPVVTIMGHVDHGKTSLLDAIRETKVAQGEAGGITQHIGAYHVDVEHEGREEQIVFLDTPGHEAFTAMRARGARVTDIAVLVVAADDGVQPQTVEAISHAKAAEVPIVVAINKIDKVDAQPDRVKQELTEYGLVPEEWGGETIMVEVSALQRENLDTLLEMILLVAEVGELRANPDREAKGTVIEANLDKSRGPVATLLVQNGTLRVGDTLVAGSVLGKVRAMINDRGKRVESAGPSWPVEVLGLSDVPAAGDEFEVFENEKEARALAQHRASEQRQSRLAQVMASRRVTLNSLSAQAQEGDLKELNLILKADVQGSVEAILGALKQLPQNEVQIRVLLGAPGEITETDVDLAAASGAVIVGFNTTLATGARSAADEAAVDVREYNIIYKLLDDIQGAMEGLLEPEQVEEALGQVEVRAVFPVGRGAVAGCYVLSGKVIRNCKLRVLRNGKVIYEGSVDSLKRMKDDVKEVNAGYECGIGIDRFNDWVVGDIIESYQMVSKRRTLSQS